MTDIFYWSSMHLNSNHFNTICKNFDLIKSVFVSVIHNKLWSTLVMEVDRQTSSKTCEICTFGVDVQDYINPTPKFQSAYCECRRPIPVSKWYDWLNVSKLNLTLTQQAHICYFETKTFTLGVLQKRGVLWLERKLLLAMLVHFHPLLIHFGAWSAYIGTSLALVTK